MLRLYDPRAGAEPVRITDGHSGVKGSRVVWLGDRDRIATTGVSFRMHALKGVTQAHGYLV